MRQTGSDTRPSESERRYREIFHSSSDAIFLMDLTPEGRFRFAEINPADEKLIGRTNDEVAGKFVEDISPNEGMAEAAIANFRRCIAAGCTLNFEETLDFSQGPRQLNTTLIPLRDDDGNIYRIAGIVRDVTEQRQAVEKFALLDFALNHVREAAFLIDEKGRFHYVNDESCRILDYAREELLHLEVGDVDPDWPEELWPEHWRSLKESGTLVFEGRHKARDGRIFPVEISANYFEYGGRGYNLALARDITERKLEEGVNAARLHLVQFSLTHSLDELLEETLNEAEKLTGSLIGFYHFVEVDQNSLTLQNWSARTKAEFCKAEGKGLHYPISEAGVWTDCIRERKPIVHNDYASLPHRKGLPEGHAAVVRELVVPVFRGEKVSAILGVGNKPTDYTDKDVEVVSLIGDLAWEIAERKRTEDALEDERKLFIGGPNVAFKWRAADGWPVEYVSPNVMEQFGYAPEDLTSGKVSYAGLVHPDDLARVAQEVAAYSAEQAPYFEQEYRIVRADGQYRWIYDFTVAIRNAVGAITHYHGHIRDITERKRSEQRLGLLDFALNHVHEPAYLIDRSDMGFLYVNDEACRALGFSREELLEMTVFDIDPDYTPEMAAEVRHQADLAGSVTLERQHRAKDGRVFPVEIYTSVFEYDGKSVSISLSRDISERKRAQAELQRLNETLEQRVQEELAKNREKDHLLIQQSRLAAMGEMVHNIAHQWRQPINVLSILLSNLQDSYDYGELTKAELHEKVSKGKQVVQSMSSTIDDFRDFFRPGKEKGKFSVGRCLHEVEGILGASLSHWDIALTNGIDEAVCADGYSNEFSQVLLNVITNAKEAIVSTRREGGRIRVRAAERDGMIEVRVADNGGGIPEDVLPKIFDPYFTTKDKGSGIGLYMSKMIIEGNMDGAISARNIEGGAEILIRVPAAKS